MIGWSKNGGVKSENGFFLGGFLYAVRSKSDSAAV